MFWIWCYLCPKQHKPRYLSSVYVYLFNFLFPSKQCIIIYEHYSHSQIKAKGEAVPLEAFSGRECWGKLRFPDYMTTAQDGGKLSALSTGNLYRL